MLRQSFLASVKPKVLPRREFVIVKALVFADSSAGTGPWRVGVTYPNDGGYGIGAELWVDPRCPDLFTANPSTGNRGIVMYTAV